MKIQTLLGLCLSASLLFVGSAAVADDSQSNNRSARAVQVHIDKEGRKTAPAEADDGVTTPVAAATTATDSEISKVMPAENSDVQYKADGSMSAQLGSANLKYVVMTIDKDGKKSVSHQSAAELESGLKTQPVEREEK